MFICTYRYKHKNTYRQTHKYSLHKITKAKTMLNTQELTHLQEFTHINKKKQEHKAVNQKSNQIQALLYSFIYITVTKENI